MVDVHENIAPASSALATLAARGYLEQASDLAAIDRALLSDSVTFYDGFDPTGRSLHTGHLLGIMAMRILQQHGHRPIALLGGGTARIGDPSGKTETRRILDAETIADNTARLREQFSKFVQFGGATSHGALLLDNSAWLLDLKYIDFLRDIGVHFTVNRMIATKTYRERLDCEQALSFLEFNYQLLQAYDFLHLHRTHGCTLQIGGSDQWGNMIAGVELIRRVMGRDDGQASVFCMTTPLLTMADGRKMGKTERGAIWLDPELLSPFDYYQFWISRHDEDIERLLRLYTEVPLEEIQALCAVEGAELRTAKTRLAFEATKLLHGEDDAHRAQTASVQAFGGGDDWSAVPAIELPVSSIRLIDLVVDEQVGAFTSKRQARQRIEEGAVRVDGSPCTDPNAEFHADQFREQGLRLQAGKRTRYRILFPGISGG